MSLSPSDRAALLNLFPDLNSRGISGAALDRAIDAWYARDCYDDPLLNELDDRNDTNVEITDR